MRKAVIFASILMAFLFSFSSLPATENITQNTTADFTAKEIIEKMDNQMRGTTSHAVYTMKITNPKWQRTLKMKNWSEGENKTFILVEYPPKEKGITYLKIKNEMWNYLPSVERIIKIPPSMMMQSWMGSDFTNDDLVKQSSVVDDYVQTKLSDETYQGRRAYVLKLVAKPEAAVTWSLIKIWIDQEYFMPLKEEFYDEKNELINVMYFENHQMVGTRWFPSRWRMIPQKKPGHETQIELTEIVFDGPLPADLFTQSALKRFSR
jgi:outer membrane lipoprotein-sorting protein